MDVLQKERVDGHEADKQQLRQLENEDEVNLFRNNALNKIIKIYHLLLDIEEHNPHSEGEYFKNKIEEIIQNVERQYVEMVDLIQDKKNELDKGLSPERIQQFLQFKADESHVGDQCQVCLEEVEVGRLMK